MLDPSYRGSPTLAVRFPAVASKSESEKRKTNLFAISPIAACKPLSPRDRAGKGRCRTVAGDPRRAQRANIGDGRRSAVVFGFEPKTPQVERCPFLRTVLVLDEGGLFAWRKALPKRLTEQTRVGDFDLG